MSSYSLLKINGLKTYFYTERGVAKAVDGIDFSLNLGETLGIVGESGCGKSVTALSIMRLVPQPPGKIVDGNINFNGADLLTLSTAQMRAIRGKEISMIFQEPMTSLNPLLTIGKQISEVIRLHEGLSHRDSVGKTVEMLRLVGISDPEKRVRDYPNQLSGGMRQRVMIAMALSCNPKILIADEPTTALDVTIEAQILRLIAELQQKFGMAVMLITHNLGIVAHMATRGIVMYMGKIVEEANVHSLFKEALHPYTLGLLNSLPNFYEDTGRKKRLETIPGVVGSLRSIPSGCYFWPRCKSAKNICSRDIPPLYEVSPRHKVRCWLFQKGKTL